MSLKYLVKIENVSTTVGIECSDGGKIEIKYFGADLPAGAEQFCFRETLTTDFGLQKVLTNKTSAAFEVIRRHSATVPHVTNIALVLEAKDHRRKLPLRKPLPNIRSLLIRGTSNTELLYHWFNQISESPIDDIQIDLPHNAMLHGIANIEMVRNAKSLLITNGYCDVTDEQLQEFKCDHIDLKSPNITMAGLKDFLKRVDREDVKNREHIKRDVMVKVPHGINPMMVASDLIPENYSHFLKIFNEDMTIEYPRHRKWNF